MDWGFSPPGPAGAKGELCDESVEPEVAFRDGLQQKDVWPPNRVAEPRLLIPEKLLRSIPEPEEMSRSLNHQVQTSPILRRVPGIHENWSGRRSQFDNVGHLCARHARHGIVSNNQIMDCRVEQSKRFLRSPHGID